MEELISFGEWVRRSRKKLDLTQQGLADRVYCSINSIKKIETDARRPSHHLAELLAEHLKVPEDQRLLFIECARGLRSVDVLRQLDQDRGTDFSHAHQRVQPDHSPVSGFSIIGRETELEELNRLLRSTRLVTITGPGGIGKSTLAQAIISNYRMRGQSAVLVPLDGINAVGQIPQATTSALGFVVEADPVRQVLEYLKAKKFLLVFDNFEHLLGDASFIADILRQTTAVTLLITSRERLRVHGEQVYPLQGLRFPENASSTDLESYPAPNLFLTIARRLLPDFKPVNPKDVLQICQITEGLPLALEMAASWVDTLALTDIIAELNRTLDILIHTDPQVSSRHRSMRSVFDSTWQLLNETERDVFSRLCVFRGGFTRQAAQAVAGASPTLLAVLVRRSMLKLDTVSGRYSIHELLLHYGEDRLRDYRNLTEVQQRHLQFFLDEAESLGTKLHTFEQFELFDRLDMDQDNIRAALFWALTDPEQSEAGARLVSDLCWYWRIRSRVIEARQWLERALQTDLESAELKASLHFHAGHFGWMQDDIEFARMHQQTSLELWQSLGASGVNGAAYSYEALGMIANLENDLAKSNEQFLLSVPLFEESRDAWGLAFAQMNLGANAVWAGDFDTAEKYLQTSEGYFRKCGDDWTLSLLLGFYGWMEFRRGNIAKAKSIAEETRQLREKLGHTHSIVDSLDLLARIALKLNDRKTARQLITSAIELADGLGNRQFLLDFQDRLAELE